MQNLMQMTLKGIFFCRKITKIELHLGASLSNLRDSGGWGLRPQTSV